MSDFVKLPVNKKKARGWKRHIRKLEQWKQAHLNLTLNRYDYEYVKIWLDPWYRLQKRNPPIWFRRLIVSALIDIYDSWHKQLIMLNQPFYLKIWFYEPNFINSQIVAAIGERINYYETLFVPDTKNKKFPFVTYIHDKYDLSAFSWESRVDEDIYFEQYDDLSADEIADLKKKAFRIIQTDDGDTMLTIRKGNIFLGERKSLNSIREIH